MAQPRVPENILMYVIRAGIVLILLTPFVVSPRTIFPYVVGKALYSRSLIEIVFVSWVLLCLFNPSWRPPRSRILVLLAAAVGVAVLSAGLGASVQRSFWSNYERMQGVIDQAHWFALAVVLVSVLRTGRDWRILLNLNLIAGMAMALMAVTEYYGYPWPYTLSINKVLPTPRVTATFGNPGFLGMYLGVNVTIALGFLARSFVPAAHPSKAPAPAREGRGKPSNRNNPPRQTRSARLPMRWAGRCFWGATALIGLWALTLTASRGPFLGFISGLAILATLYVFLARTRTARLVAAGSVGLLGLATIFLLVLLFSPAVSLFDARHANPLLSRFNYEWLGTVGERLLVWEVGIEGFIENPWLGWGPGNYVAIWGRHGPGSITTVMGGYEHSSGAMTGVYDHSHNRLIEELATKGVSGLLVHLALWGAALHIVLRAAGGMDSRERVPVLFAGAALVGYFMQSMVMPEMAVGSLQIILLLAFVAHLETAGSNPGPGQGGRVRQPASSFTGKLVWNRIVPRPSAALAGTPAIPRNGIAMRPRRRTPFARLAGSRGARVSLAAGTIVLAGGAGLLVNKAIYSSAQAVNSAYTSAAGPADSPSRTRSHFKRAIDGFQPLANYPRRILFRYAAEHWKPLRAQNRADAMQLLAMVNAEASAAVESEPGNWRIRTALIRFYRAVAVTDPEEYRKVAKDDRSS